MPDAHKACSNIASNSTALCRAFSASRRADASDASHIAATFRSCRAREPADRDAQAERRDDARAQHAAVRGGKLSGLDSFFGLLRGDEVREMPAKCVDQLFPAQVYFHALVDCASLAS